MRKDAVEAKLSPGLSNSTFGWCCWGQGVSLASTGPSPIWEGRLVMWQSDMCCLRNHTSTAMMQHMRTVVKHYGNFQSFLVADGDKAVAWPQTDPHSLGKGIWSCIL